MLHAWGRQSLFQHIGHGSLYVSCFFFSPFCSFTSSRAPACRCSLNNPPDNTPLNGTVKRGMLCARKNANTFSVSSQKTNGKRQCTLWVSLKARKPNIYTIKAWYFYLTGGSKRRTYVCVCVCLFVCFLLCCRLCLTKWPDKGPEKENYSRYKRGCWRCSIRTWLCTVRGMMRYFNRLKHKVIKSTSINCLSIFLFFKVH